ncbi:aminotransferase class IV [Porphyromonas asaccharolytica]
MSRVPLLLESIRYVDGEPELLPLHQERIDRSLAAYGVTPRWRLADYLAQHPCPASLVGVVKCRLLYDAEPLEVGYAPYHRRTIGSLRAVAAPALDYHLKWADRGALQALLELRGEADDIVIVNGEGLLTDSSYTNIALRRGNRWYTPRVPLLEGVQRAHLIAEGVLIPRDIPLAELSTYDRISLINAMMPWSERIELEIRS